MSSVVRLPKPTQLRGSGLYLFAGRIVVPADHVHDRAGRQQRRHVVGVVVDDLPVEVVVDAVQLLDAHVGIDRLEALALAAVVHVRHEADQVRRLLHLEVGVAAHVVGAGGDVEVVLVRREDGRDHVLRHDAFRIEDDADLGAIGDRLADRVIVHVEADLRAGLHQLAGALGKDVAVLADRVLDQRAAAAAAVVVDQRSRPSGARRGARRATASLRPP